MQAMPSVIPLSRTASVTSSVMSRMANPPAVRSSVSCWKTFTAPSTLLGRTCHDPPILRVRRGYVTGEPSVARAAVRGRLSLGVRRRAAAGGPTDPDASFHALVLVAVDGAVHLVRAVGREGEPEGLVRAGVDVAALGLFPVTALLDVEGVSDLAVVRDVELVRAGLQQGDRAGVERVLILRNLDRLDHARPAATAAAAGGEEEHGEEGEQTAHVRATRRDAV